MKILHCNTHDAAGGAAIAAWRIHNALLTADQESRMYVRVAQTSSPTVLSCKASISRRLWNKISNKFEYLIRQHFYAPPQTAGYYTLNILPWGYVSTLPVIGQAITHLHWITERFILIDALSSIQTPIVWTLHDQWAMTGGCHYTQDCRGFTLQCGKCPQLGSKSNHDLSRQEWKRKQRAFKIKHVHIVCPSKWMASVAQESSLLQNFSYTVIPYCLPIDIYRPIDKILARNLLNIPDDGKPIILFGAISGIGDRRKGYDLLTTALKKIPHNTYRSLVFGTCAPLGEQDKDTIWLGRLHDDISLALAYSAADMFICPSREDNLPNTVMESLACGTPVVGFDIGGLPDMVTHGKNGFLAKPYDTNELAHHIQMLITDSDLRKRMGHDAREKVECCYSPNVIARKYINVYEEVLANT